MRCLLGGAGDLKSLPSPHTTLPTCIRFDSKPGG